MILTKVPSVRMSAFLTSQIYDDNSGDASDIIYCDHHATTPVDPLVVEAMLPYFTKCFANPSSYSYALGRTAKLAVDQARADIARAINANPSEIIFTSGATEANNLAIKGIAEAYCDKGRHLITVATEHRAVLEPLQYLSKLGFRVTVLPVQKDGLVELEQLQSAIRPDTIMISIMIANNEIGVIQPIEKISKIAHSHGVLLHTDAAQAIGKIPLDVQSLSIDLMSLTSHKVYGPKGIGALYVNKNSKICLAPQIQGGGQEFNLRSGTLNVPLIVGFAKAIDLALNRMNDDTIHLTKIRDYLWQNLCAGIPDLILNGSLDNRLPGNLNVSIPGVDGVALLLSLRDEIAVSSGSACSAGKPSHVLLALGHTETLAQASLRFGLGRSNTLNQMNRVASKVIKTVHSLRHLSGYLPGTHKTD